MTVNDGVHSIVEPDIIHITREGGYTTARFAKGLEPRTPADGTKVIVRCGIVHDFRLLNEDGSAKVNPQGVYSLMFSVAPVQRTVGEYVEFAAKDIQSYSIDWCDFADLPSFADILRTIATKIDDIAAGA